MGEELTGVTLGGFGGRSPPFSPFFFFFYPPPPPPPPRSLCLSGFLQWRSAVSHAAAVAAAATAVASEARTQLGVFQNKFPLQLLLITVIIVII